MHNGKLCKSYSSTNIIRMIKFREMRWSGHVARMGQKRSAYKVWYENVKERATMKT
jgi:hypothetical protein